MVGVNLAVDPAGIFHDRSEALAERWAAEGEVEIPGNVDERRLLEEMIRRAPPSADAIVLGSSRSMQLRAASFPHRKMLNLSVSGASVEDHLALYELAWEHGIQPKLVVLTLDPWVLNRNSGQDRWKSLGRAYDRALQRLELSDESRRDARLDDLHRFRQLVSPAYFQESLKSLWKEARSPRSSGAFSRRLTRDGSTDYPRAFVEAPPESVRQLADLFVRGPEVYALDGFSGVDERALTLLEGLVKTLRARNVGLRIFLAPYHPRVYAFLASNERYRAVKTAESRFRDLAAREGIPVIGSYDPAACGFGDHDFLDGMHARESAIARLFSSGK
jgi:hypothetical protein